MSVDRRLVEKTAEEKELFDKSMKLFQVHLGKAATMNYELLKDLRPIGRKYEQLLATHVSSLLKNPSATNFKEALRELEKIRSGFEKESRPVFEKASAVLDAKISEKDSRMVNKDVKKKKEAEQKQRDTEAVKKVIADFQNESVRIMTEIQSSIRNGLESLNRYFADGRRVIDQKLSEMKALELSTLLKAKIPGISSSYKIDAQENASDDIKRIAANFNGKTDKGPISIEDEKISYEKLLAFVDDLLPGVSPEEKKNFLKNYGNMITVENRYTALYSEYIDWTGQKGEDWRKAESYGPAQVSYKTALNTGKENLELIRKHFPKAAEKIETLKNPNKDQIIENLKLEKDNSLIFGLIEFAKAYRLYASQRQNGDQNARALMIAAYSGKLTSPIGAKVQTMLIEMNTNDAKEIQARWRLPIDGDCGPTTQALMHIVSNNLHIPFPAEAFRDGIGANEQARMLEAWLEKVKPEWKRELEIKLSHLEKNPDAEELRELVVNRYSALTQLFGVISKHYSNPKDIQEMFDAYIMKKDPRFLDTCFKKDIFSKNVKDIDHAKFLKEVIAAFRTAITIDDQYNGVVPTVYEKPKYVTGEAPYIKPKKPKNFMMRAAMERSYSMAKF